MSRKLLWIAVIVVAIPLVFLAAVLLTPSRPPAPVPSPNGYDSFIQAAQMLPADDFQYVKASIEDLRPRLPSHREALSLLRSGLKLKSRVPAATASQVDTQLQQAGSLKKLILVLEAEARVAEADRRHEAVAQSGLDIVCLGHAGTRGGPLVFALVGIAIENRGLAVLERQLPHLHSATRSNAVAVLQQIEAASETKADVLNNERAWVRQVHGAKGSIMRLLTQKQLRATETKFAALHQSVQTRRKALIQSLQQPGSP